MNFEFANWIKEGLEEIGLTGWYDVETGVGYVGTYQLYGSKSVDTALELFAKYGIDYADLEEIYDGTFWWFKYHVIL